MVQPRVEETVGLEQQVVMSDKENGGFSQTDTIKPVLRPQMKAAFRPAFHIGAQEALPRVVLVGGPDVDARLQLMQALRDRFQVSALGSDPGLRSRFLVAGFDYDVYHLNRRTNPISDLRTLGQLVSVLRRRKPEIVHTFDTKPNVWGRLAARLSGVPVVIGTITGIGSLYGGHGLKPKLLWPVYRSLQTLACHISDLTVFQNQDDQGYFAALGMAPEQRTKIIPGSGISTTVFDPGVHSEAERTKLKHELGLRDNEIVVTMISRVIRSKGVLEFMTAAQDIRKAYPDSRFLLVGPEDPQSQDRLSLEELDRLKRVVTCTGLRRDISLILAISDIFVLPSGYREGIPRALLEAASMGLPLITTNAPGCRDVVIHGLNGFLMEVGDAAALDQMIMRLIEQPELRRSFGRASRQRVEEHFNLAAIADQISAMYQELLSSKHVHH